MGVEKLLEEIPEAYYWVGLLMADGCIWENIRILLGLQIRDEEHIKKFCNFISSNITHRKIATNGKFHDYCCTSRYDKINIPIIASKFNLKSRKTYNPPNELYIKDDNLFLAFLIGYIDGDGSICYNKKANTNELSVECHGSWESVLNKWFGRAWDIANIRDLG